MAVLPSVDGRPQPSSRSVLVPSLSVTYVLDVQKTLISWVAAAAVASVLAACSDGGGDSSATTVPAQCSFTDEGSGLPIEGTAGSRLTDSRGMSYNIGADCTLEFAECSVNMANGAVAGQPQSTFTGPNGAPMIFSETCEPIPDPAFSPLSPELIAACDSVEGVFTLAVSDDEWSCGEVPLGDTTDGSDAVNAVLAPFCVEPAVFTSGMMSSVAPWIAGWSCSPPPNIVEGDVVVVCDTIGGTLTQTGEEDWTCDDVPLSESTEEFGDYHASLLQLCVTGEFTAEIRNSELPYSAMYACSTTDAGSGSEPSADGADAVTAACDSVGGTLDLIDVGNWTCTNVNLGDTTDDYAVIDGVLAPYCATPSEFTSGLLSAAAPWLAGWSCRPV